MERINCPICNGATSGRPAVIAPFVVQTCGLEQSTTQVRYCRSCEFVFYQRGLADEEATKLYTNYRGEEYNKVRISLEPYYAGLIHDFEDPLSSYYVNRIIENIDLIDVYPELPRNCTALDFGGDGDVLRRIFPNGQIFVDDLNAGKSPDQPSTYQFIFASNVFEHVSDPVTVLKALSERLDHEGVIYIDVPHPSQASLGEGLLWQGRHGGELYEMHEHILHFSKQSLAILARTAGLEVFFEHSSRGAHRNLTILAGHPESSIVQRLIVQKAARELDFEIKMMRAEVRGAFAHTETILKHFAELRPQVAELRTQAVDLRTQVAELRNQVGAMQRRSERKKFDIGRVFQKVKNKLGRH